MAGNRVISAVLTLKDKDFSANAKKATSATKDLQRRMKSAKGSIKDFGASAVQGMKNTAKGFAIAGGAAVALGVSAFAATKKVAEGFDKIAKTSRKMGVSTDYYQEMEYWAGQNGISQENMEKSMQRLNQRVGEARAGNKKYSGALKSLGLDMDAFKNGTLSTEDAMTQSISALSKMTNEQDKSALASELFGSKLAQELMPALQGGALSIEDAMKKAKQLGIVIDEDVLNAAETFNDTWDDLTRGLQAFGKKALAGVMPFFQKVLDFAVARLPAVQSAFSKVFGVAGKVISGVGKVAVSAFDIVKNKLNENGPFIDRIKDGFARVGQAAIVVKNWAVDAFQNIRDRIKENSPALDGVKSIMEDVGIKAIELKDWLVSAFESSKPAMDWLKDEGLPLVVDGISAVIEKATETYNYIKSNWDLISPVVYGIVTALAVYKTGMVVAATATSVMAGVTTAMSVAQGALNAVMAISPLGWIAIAIGAVVLAGVALYKNWDTVKETALSLWESVKEVFGGMYDWGKEKILGVAGFFVDLYKKFTDFKDTILGFKPPEWIMKIGGAIGGAASKVKGLISGNSAEDSFAVGTNRVPRDMVAQIHKDEMIIPAVQSRNLRKQGVTINNIDRTPPTVSNPTASPTTVNVRSNTQDFSGLTAMIAELINVIKNMPKGDTIIKVDGTNLTVTEIINELMPLLKLRLANM